MSPPRSSLAVYLRDHEAAASAGRDLFRRTAGAQRSRPYGPELEALAAEVDQDLRSLRSLMRQAGVTPDLLLGTVLRVGERVSRLKPNTRLLQRSPLTDLVEIEGLLDAVRAKKAGWTAIGAAAGWLASIIDPAQVAELSVRADDQLDRLQALHVGVAADVLRADR